MAGAPVTWEQELIAATLACARSAVSGVPAAGLWNLLGARRAGVELSVSPDGSRCSGLVVRRVELPRAHVTRLGPIPVTTVARTLIDIAANVDRKRLAEMFDDAAKRKLVNVTRLRRTLEELGPRHGSASVRRIIAERDGIDVPRTVMESRFLEVVMKYKLPVPDLQHSVRLPGGGRAFIDFAYPDARLAIEVDGFDSHSEFADWQRDRTRQNGLIVLGWTVLRFTREDIERRPRATARMIAAMLSSLRAARGIV